MIYDRALDTDKQKRPDLDGDTALNKREMDSKKRQKRERKNITMNKCA